VGATAPAQTESVGERLENREEKMLEDFGVTEATGEMPACTLPDSGSRSRLPTSHGESPHWPRTLASRGGRERFSAPGSLRMPTTSPTQTEAAPIAGATLPPMDGSETTARASRGFVDSRRSRLTRVTHEHGPLHFEL
jgi:hypothetical protein